VAPSQRTTLVFSDVHLTCPEPLDTRRPLWQRRKQPAMFVDDELAALIRHVRATPAHAPA